LLHGLSVFQQTIHLGLYVVFDGIGIGWVVLHQRSAVTPPG
jgi:hypothetical protein